MPKKIFLFEHGLVPAQAVCLGHLITNLRQPNLNYYNPSTAPDWPVTEVPHTKFHQLVTTDKSLRLRGELAKLLTGIAVDTTDHNITIYGESARQRTLNNPRDYWEKIAQSEETRKWVDKTVRVYKDDIYLVVGTYTVTNPTYTYSSSYVHTVGGGAEISTTGIIDPGRDMNSITISVDGSIHNTATAKQVRSFDAVGEMAYAVQYQRLKTKRLGIWKRKPEDIVPEKKTNWFNFSKEQSKEGVQETIVTGELEDDGWELENKAEEGEWETVVVGDEEFFFPQDEDSEDDDDETEDEEEDE